MRIGWIALTGALAVIGCGSGDRRFGAVSADQMMYAATMKAIDAWNSQSGGKVGLVWVSDPDLADVVVSAGSLSWRCGATYWEHDDEPSDYSTAHWSAISVDVTSALCKDTVPAIVTAHELGHWMAGRRAHLLDDVSLMRSGMSPTPRELKITPMDVDYVYGGTPEPLGE